MSFTMSFRTVCAAEKSYALCLFADPLYGGHERNSRRQKIYCTSQKAVYAMRSYCASVCHSQVVAKRPSSLSVISVVLVFQHQILYDGVVHGERWKWNTLKRATNWRRSGETSSERHRRNEFVARMSTGEHVVLKLANFNTMSVDNRIGFTERWKNCTSSSAVSGRNVDISRREL